MNEFGVIGKSGKFYSCDRCEHIPTALSNIEDAPFVMVYDNLLHTEVKANKKQLKTIFDWCILYKVKFEDVAIHPIWDN